MSTIGVNVKVTSSTDNTRASLSEFYKAFSSDTVTQKIPLKIESAETEEIDLSNSDFLIIVGDDYALENEVLEVDLEDSLSNTFTINNVSFMFFNSTNLSKVSIKNTSDVIIDVFVVY